MSGLLNSDEEVIDAIDSRMEPSFTSDIVPLGLTTKGAISKNTSRVADEDVIRQFIQHNKIISLRLRHILWMVTLKWHL